MHIGPSIQFAQKGMEEQATQGGLALSRNHLPRLLFSAKSATHPVQVAEVVRQVTQLEIVVQARQITRLSKKYNWDQYNTQ